MKIPCKYCGKWFTVRNLHQKYCSDWCRKANKPIQARKTVNSRQQKYFALFEKGMPREEVCTQLNASPRMARIMFKKYLQHTGGTNVALCKNCGKEFDNARGNHKYCSDECRREYMVKYQAKYRGVACPHIKGDRTTTQQMYAALFATGLTPTEVSRQLGVSRQAAHAMWKILVGGNQYGNL